VNILGLIISGQLRTGTAALVDLSHRASSEAG